jgi:hypothetical protein
LDALGLTAGESQRVSEICRTIFSQSLTIAAPRSYLTNTGRDWSDWKASSRDDKAFMSTNRESRTWVTPELGEEGEMLRQRLRAGLAQCMNQERAAVFFQQTTNQFFRDWNNLGDLEVDVTVFRTSPSTIGWATEYRRNGKPRMGFGWCREVPEALMPFARAWQEPTPNSGSSTNR